MAKRREKKGGKKKDIIFGTKHLQKKPYNSNWKKQRSYKIKPSVEHQCYVYYLDQFFKYIL